MGRKKSTVTENNKTKNIKLKSLEEIPINMIDPNKDIRITTDTIDSSLNETIEENLTENIQTIINTINNTDVQDNSVNEIIETNQSIDANQFIDTNQSIETTELKLENIYSESDDIIKIKRTDSNKDLNILINETYVKSLIDINNIINTIIDNSIKTNDYIDELNNKEYLLDEKQLNNILTDKSTDNILNNYTLDDLKKIFNQMKEAVIIIQIINGNIKFIEKKGYESRNQSVIDLILKTNSYKTLPDIQFIIFTNDLLNDLNINNKPYLFTFCKKENYKTKLFPNFNFNHWIESNIASYENIYNSFTNNNITWENKIDSIFWSGANTNNIRKKIHDSSKSYPNFNINLLNKNKNNFIPMEETLKYKYLLNMNGHTYGGRLNYLFLTGSCIIILKNGNKENNYEEYFYKYFIPNEDYIQIEYNDNEKGELIINRIITEIQKYDCENIAKRCYEKAVSLFNMNSIYNYIYESISDLSNNNIITEELKNTISYIPPLNYFFKDRLDNNLSFNFTGKDFELNLIDNDNNNSINIKIMNDNTKIKLNKVIIYDKYTPYILNEQKSQNFQILIENNQLLITINQKYNIIKIDLPDQKINITNNEILSENGGWLIV